MSSNQKDKEAVSDREQRAVKRAQKAIEKVTAGEQAAALRAEIAVNQARLLAIEAHQRAMIDDDDEVFVSAGLESTTSLAGALDASKQLAAGQPSTTSTTLTPLLPTASGAGPATTQAKPGALDASVTVSGGAKASVGEAVSSPVTSPLPVSASSPNANLDPQPPSAVGPGKAGDRQMRARRLESFSESVTKADLAAQAHASAPAGKLRAATRVALEHSLARLVRSGEALTTSGDAVGVLSELLESGLNSPVGTAAWRGAAPRASTADSACALVALVADGLHLPPFDLGTALAHCTVVLDLPLVPQFHAAVAVLALAHHSDGTSFTAAMAENAALNLISARVDAAVGMQLPAPGSYDVRAATLAVLAKHDLLMQARRSAPQPSPAATQPASQSVRRAPKSAPAKAPAPAPVHAIDQRSSRTPAVAATPGARSQTPGRVTDRSGDKCNYCNELGHWKRECPQLRASDASADVHVTSSEDTSDEYEVSLLPFLPASPYTASCYVVAALSVDAAATPLYAPVVLHGAAVTCAAVALLDTGASVSVTDMSTARVMRLPLHRSRTLSIKGVGTGVPVLGEVSIGVECGGGTLTCVSLVVREVPFDLLIGMSALLRSGSALDFPVDAPPRVRMSSRGTWVDAVAPPSPAPALTMPVSTAPPLRSALRAGSVMECLTLVEQDVPDAALSPSVVFVETDVGVYEVTVELTEEDVLAGISMGQLATWLQHTLSEGPPARADVGEVNLALGVESLVAARVQAYERADEAARQGQAWSLPLPDSTPVAPLLGDDEGVGDFSTYRDVQFGPSLSPVCRARCEALCEQYAHVFGGSKAPGARRSPPTNKCNRVLRLLLYPNASLDEVRAHIRHQRPDDAAALREHGLRLLAEGRVQRSTAAVATSRAFAVKRADGGWRFVVALQGVNRVLLPQHAPMPSIRVLLDRLAEQELLGSFDLTAAFEQFRVRVQDRPLLATWFAPDLLLEWLVAPFGLKTMPAITQTALSESFADESLCIAVYIDDVLHGAKDEAGVERGLRHVLSRADRDGWTLTGRKCRVGFKELLLLGKLVSHNSIRADPAALAAIREYTRPATVPQLRSFLGFYNALAPHVRQAASFAAPLFAASGNTQRGKLVWRPDMLVAWDACLALATSPEVIVPFSSTRRLFAITDWSKSGAGGVLAHMSDDESRFEVICAMSHTNTTGERSDGAPLGELGALVRLVKAFPMYTRAVAVVYWVTDSLISAQGMVSEHSRKADKLLRWQNELSGMTIVPIHVDGRRNVIANALSRQSEALGVPNGSQEVFPLTDAAVLAAPGAAAAGAAVAVGASAAAGAAVAVGAGVAAGVAAAPLPVPVAGALGGVGVGAAAPLLELTDDEKREVAEFLGRCRGGLPQADRAAIIDAAADARVTQAERDAVVLLEWLHAQSNDTALVELHEIAADRRAAAVAGGPPLPVPDARAGAVLRPFYRVDGVLCVREGDGVGDDSVRVVVPAGCVTATVHAVHGGQLHQGVGVAHWHARRSLLIARRAFYWRTMATDIAKYCAHCVVCQRLRLLVAQGPANLGDMEVGNNVERLSDWQIDMNTLEGVSLCVMVELYSGLVYVRDLADKTAASMLMAFESLIACFGKPKRIWSDMGMEMQREFAAFAAAMGIDVVEGHRYNPQCVARVSAVHKQLGRGLAKARALGVGASTASVVLRLAHEWNIAPLELNADMSPYKVMFARDPPAVLFTGLDGSALRKVTLAGTPARLMAATVSELQLVYQAGAQERADHRAKRRAVHEQSYGLHRTPALELAAGDRVWARYPPDDTEGTKTEMRLQWTGPWVVQSVDALTSVVKLRYEFDFEVVVPVDIEVHVRNTRLFLEAKPIDSPYTRVDLQEARWASSQSAAPLGGTSAYPPSIRIKIDAALLAHEAKKAAQRAARLAAPATGAVAPVSVPGVSAGVASSHVAADAAVVAEQALAAKAAGVAARQQAAAEVASQQAVVAEQASRAAAAVVLARVANAERGARDRSAVAITQTRHLSAGVQYSVTRGDGSSQWVEADADELQTPRGRQLVADFAAADRAARLASRVVRQVSFAMLEERVPTMSMRSTLYRVANRNRL